NRVSVLAGSSVLMALAIGLILASIGFVQARQQALNARAQTARADRNLALAFFADVNTIYSKEAEESARDALAIDKDLYGEDHSEVAQSLHILAWVLVKTKPEDAISLERESIAMQRRHLVDVRPFDLAWSLFNLACLLEDKGEVAEPESIFRE